MTATFYRMQTTVAAALMLAVSVAVAPARDFVLPNGQTLKNVRVIKMDDRTVTLAHSGGIQQFEIATLPPKSLAALTTSMTTEEQTAVTAESRRVDWDAANLMPDDLKAIVQEGSKVRLNVVVLQVLQEGLLCSGAGTDLLTSKPVALGKTFFLRGQFKNVAKDDKRTFPAVRYGSYAFVSAIGTSVTVSQWLFAGKDN